MDNNESYDVQNIKGYCLENKTIDVLSIIRKHLIAKKESGKLTEDYANGAIDSAEIIHRILCKMLCNVDSATG